METNIYIKNENGVRVYAERMTAHDVWTVVYEDGITESMYGNEFRRRFSSMELLLRNENISYMNGEFYLFNNNRFVYRNAVTKNFLKEAASTLTLEMWRMMIITTVECYFRDFSLSVIAKINEGKLDNLYKELRTSPDEPHPE